MKKILLIGFVVVMLLASATISYTDGIKYGDVNGDQSVDAADALATLKHAAKLEELEGDALVAADVTGDNNLDANDALDILKYAAKLIDSFTAENMVQATDEPTATPVITPIPTDPPIDIGPVVYPTQIPLPVVEADPANYVEGTALEPVELNGATEENGIYTFTEENAANRKGISFNNPFVGMNELVESYDKAFEGQSLNLTELQKAVYDPEATYPEPVWSTGASLSFWAKYEWDNKKLSNDEPILVFHRSKRGSRDFAISLLLDGTVRFEEGEDAHNSFRADGAVCGNVDEWNYYTITIKNDWITVYVNGQECAYHRVSLSKEAIGLFNGGYMTKYNVPGDLTEEQLSNDIRNYYRTSGSFSGNNLVPEATRIDNGVYSASGYHTGARLLMECMIDSEAELVIGGATTFKATGNMGKTTHELDAGTQAAGVKAYYTALTPEQVAANYAAEAETFLK